MVHQPADANRSEFSVYENDIVTDEYRRGRNQATLASCRTHNRDSLAWLPGVL